MQEPERIRCDYDDIVGFPEWVFGMPEERHETEADTVPARLNDVQDHQASSQERRSLAKALERAEKRGCKIFAKLKESSG